MTSARDVGSTDIIRKNLIKEGRSNELQSQVLLFWEALGDLGSGLAKRWIAAGYSVVIGSRSAEKAQAFAKELGDNARGDDNVGAAKSADVGGFSPCRSVVMKPRFLK